MQTRITSCCCVVISKTPTLMTHRVMNASQPASRPMMSAAGEQQVALQQRSSRRPLTSHRCFWWLRRCTGIHRIDVA